LSSARIRRCYWGYYGVRWPLACSGRWPMTFAVGSRTGERRFIEIICPALTRRRSARARPSRARQVVQIFPGPNAVGVGRARRLKLRSLFGTPCEVLVIIRDLKHHPLGYFVPHIVGKTVRFVGAFAPVLRVANKGGRHKVILTRPPQVARTSPPRFHPFPHNQTDHYPTQRVR